MTREVIKDITLVVIALLCAIVLITVNASYSASACDTGVAYTMRDGSIICK